MKDFNRREAYPDFDEFEDVETLVSTERICTIRTKKLLPALWLMHDAGWRIYEILPDDKDWVEANILTYYKPKNI